MLTWGWSASQDLRFRRAFGLGRQQMRHMFDMQEVVGWMGFDQRSLDTTAQRLLHPSFSRDKPPPSAADSCYWSEQPGQLSDAQVKQAALEAIVTGELCRLLHAWHTCRLPARPCPACAFPYGGFITLPHLYVCAHPGCDTSVFSGLAEYEKHCKGTRHALRFRTARCSECGRTVFDKTPLQQQPAAASDGAGAISDDRGGGGWDDGDGEYGDAADLYGSSGRRPAMGGPGRGGAMGGPGRGSARFGSAMGVPGRGRFGAMGGPGRGSGRFSAMAGPGRADKGGSIRQCDVVKTVASGDEYDNSSWV